MCSNYVSPYYQQPQGGVEIHYMGEADRLNAFDRKSIEDFWDKEVADTCDESEVFLLLLDQLSNVFEFLGRSTDPKLSAARLWIFLYMVRPDLIQYETKSSAAERLGVEGRELRFLQEDLISSLPAFRPVKVRPRDFTKSDNIRRGMKIRALRDAGGSCHQSVDDYFSEAWPVRDAIAQ